LGSPASPTRLGATHRSPPGPTTAIASLATADCGRKTASRTSAPLPCTGFSAYLLREEERPKSTRGSRIAKGNNWLRDGSGGPRARPPLPHVRYGSLADVIAPRRVGLRAKSGHDRPHIDLPP